VAKEYRPYTLGYTPLSTRHMFKHKGVVCGIPPIESIFIDNSEPKSAKEENLEEGKIEDSGNYLALAKWKRRTISTVRDFPPILE
jgi:nicotinate-nucleotide pyrophosphorylase